MRTAWWWPGARWSPPTGTRWVRSPQAPSSRQARRETAAQWWSRSGWRWGRNRRHPPWVYSRRRPSTRRRRYRGLRLAGASADAAPSDRVGQPVFGSSVAPRKTCRPFRTSADRIRIPEPPTGGEQSRRQPEPCRLYRPPARAPQNLSLGRSKGLPVIPKSHELHLSSGQRTNGRPAPAQAPGPPAPPARDDAPGQVGLADGLRRSTTGRCRGEAACCPWSLPTRGGNRWANSEARGL